MKKSLFAKLAYLYSFIVFATFLIYAISVADDNWTVDFKEHKTFLTIFFGLFIISAILLGINLISNKDKKDKIQGKTIVSGLTLVVFFIVWRVLMEIF
ncbi:hypothetical protein I6J18_12425 [Peribacillus psychrosaccharolyticus]|uniref:Uncharacterized protein n=1 Tax=Peribacillus psychrosaccharolyticus TaxID=1407 RepID=A0A974NIL6_PERPY|nr:hypothetical protein [Peribacillus psychrosaccharolyticus]MEC2057618.1 hypothetical protein [Peribacillus psychrosaccharolyticus]MED3744763.1 hypothetical protein [Peribacillus psychrosaccharolyticus]QQS98561.1 hypothetical protein I6J18_12425 [Peribacillus psychrosaccharolyticus]